MTIAPIFSVICALTAATVAIAFACPGPRDMDAFAHWLKTRMPTHQLDGLSQFMERFRLREEDAEFWRISKGVPGLAHRFVNTILFLLIVRALYKKRYISIHDLGYVYGNAALQAWFTAWAIPEAILCLLIHPMPHVSSRMALVYHGDVVRQTNVLWSASCEGSSTPNLEFLL